MPRCGPIEGVRSEENWNVGPRQKGVCRAAKDENVDSLMIRLVGLALAVLMMAGMTIYTGLFPKASAKAADTHAAVISVQEGHVAAEDVQQNV